MASLNKVFLIGNLTKDPVVRKMPSGEDVADMRLAVSRRFRDRTGKDRDETLFINVTVFGNRAAVVGKYLRLGSPVLIEGRLKLDEWTDREGKRQSRISVVAENFEFLGGERAAPNATVVASSGHEAESGSAAEGESEPVHEEADEDRLTGGRRGSDDRATPWRGMTRTSEADNESPLPF